MNNVMEYQVKKIMKSYDRISSIKEVMNLIETYNYLQYMKNVFAVFINNNIDSKIINDAMKQVIDNINRKLGSNYIFNDSNNYVDFFDIIINDIYKRRDDILKKEIQNMIIERCGINA